MPTLDWIGKRAVLNHYRTVPYRLLSCDPKLSAGDPDSGNLLVEGDNVEALKALLPYYAGQVKCIYIDPPYNTGKELWAYNDKVDSPEIRSWLGRVVGAEAEDLSRHDKWLCMMYPRVSLLQSFLRRDGVLFVSIDDNELASATFLFDEIFGRRNRVGVIIWKNATDNNPTRISTEHEYVLCYARDIDATEPVWTQANPPQKQLILDHYEALKSRGLSVEEIQKELRRFIRENREAVGPLSHYDRVDDDGPFTGSRKVHNPGREGYRYDVLHPVTGKPCKEPARGYRYPPETMRELEKSGRLLFGDDESQIIQIKVYLRDYAASLKSVMEIDGRTGANALESIFGNRETFRNPKSVEFVQSLLEFTAKGDDIVLDSFAGSGTTGHAVLAANETDGGSRRFILVELDGNIASTVTAARNVSMKVRQIRFAFSDSRMCRSWSFPVVALGQAEGAAAPQAG